MDKEASEKFTTKHAFQSSEFKTVYVMWLYIGLINFGGKNACLSTFNILTPPHTQVSHVYIWVDEGVPEAEGCSL